MFCDYLSGTPYVAESETAHEYIIDAGWFDKSDLQNLTLFPDVLKNGFWNDLENNFNEVKYLPIREMEFY